MHILCNLLRMALSGTARDLTCRGVLCLLLHPNIVAKDPHMKPSSKDSSPKLHCAPLQQLPKKQDQSSHGGPECKQVKGDGLHCRLACERAHSPAFDHSCGSARRKRPKSPHHIGHQRAAFRRRRAIQSYVEKWVPCERAGADEVRIYR